jgi:hypothetical protein
VDDVELINSIDEMFHSMKIFDVFISPFDPPGTLSKLDKLKKSKIAECDFLVCVFNRKSLRINLVKQEIEYAFTRNKFVFPFLEKPSDLRHIGRIYGSAKAHDFLRRKIETIGYTTLSKVALLQIKLGINKESIEEAKTCLETYCKQKSTHEIYRFRKFDTFRSIVIEIMSKLGYSIKEEPLFFSHRNYRRKFHSLIATKKGNKIGITCFYRSAKFKDVYLTAKLLSKLGVNERWMIVPFSSTKTKKLAKDNNVEVILFKRLLEELPPSDKEKLRQRFIQLENAQSDTIANSRFYPDLKVAIERVYCAKTSVEKGKSLEDLAECFVNLFKGLKVVGRNVRVEAEELDLVVKNEVEKIFWQRLGAPIIVECKNWTKRVGANEIRNLVLKMREVTTAFLITTHGVTSKGGALTEILEARKNRKYILVFDIGDIEEILRGTNPEEIVKNKFYSLWINA